MKGYLKPWVIGLAVCVAMVAFWLLRAGSNLPAVNAQRLHTAPIHGYVAAVISRETVATAVVLPSALVNVPDVEVVAKNVQTGALTKKVITNPAGYFQTPPLQPGTYQICVSGPGYTSSCDPQTVIVAGSTKVLDHVVPIHPTPRALFGTVYLADKVTPCFWFRPAFDVNAVFAAKVSLVDSSGTVVAGPVNGNSLGQYVLPESAAPGTFKVQAVCEKSEGVALVKLGVAPVRQNILIKNNAPQIVSFDLSKGGAGVRRANPGDVLHASVEATDLDGDTLHYKWTDDSGRSLNLPDAPEVDWPLLNTRSLNTLRVQVSDEKGGFAVGERSLRAGPDQILFAGTVFNRQNHAPIGQAQVHLNNIGVMTDAAGRFQVSVPDAPRFVMNVNKPGFALSSRIYYGRETGLQIPLDPVKKVTVNAGKGGEVALPPDECERRCKYKQPPLSLSFAPGSLVDGNGKPYTGMATIEAFQYDISLPNPIPGDMGAKFQGKTVRLSTFGSFYLQPRDAVGHPLKMAPNKSVKVSMPIDPAVLAKAPASIPFFTYEENTGMWTEHGILTRSGDRYVGLVKHFSAFNADTQFAGSACVKVILDSSFTFPVLLDASYVDPNSGLFYHNGTQATDNPIGVERMTPNVNFTLEIHDPNTNALLKSVTLNSGPGLNPAQFPDGLVNDPNFDACNGPVTIYNSNVPTGPTYLLPITGGSIQDNSTTYQNNTNAGAGGNRATFPQWLAQNGFPDANDAHAIYFNNGDLKFGRDMHCRQTNANGAVACYVSNFGIVGTDDSVTALNDARTGATPVATVAMEYDPTAANGENVQFWAYKGDGSYLAKPALDGQGAKPMPDLCLACHGGFFNGTRAQGAVFLPFDLDSFLYDTQGDPHTSSTVQEQFRRLNAFVLGTHPDTSTGNTNQPFTHLMNIWYPGGVNNSGQQFAFNTGATQLGGFTGHEPLYDNVVKKACRTCHIARNSSDDWTSFTQMSTLKGIIQGYACGSATPAAHTTFNFAMPHGEVPFKLFWENSLSSTLDSELALAPPGCPNQ